MKERPILFSGPMVRAILEGRKTQTRRPVKKPANYHGCLTGDCPHEEQRECEMSLGDASPFGRIGDRLWVRETYSIASGNGIYPVYRADAVEDDSGERNGFWIGDNFYSYEGTRRWFPSIHMPRKHCRLVLEVACVRSERLQDISADDARAEGVETINGPFDVRDKRMTIYGHAFASLWDSIYGGNLNHGGGPYAWAQNPWVWVVEFKRVEL